MKKWANYKPVEGCDDQAVLNTLRRNELLYGESAKMSTREYEMYRDVLREDWTVGKALRSLINLPLRFVFALLGFTFCGWIGWVGIVLVALKLFGVIGWPWWVAALPLEYGVLYCLYMTIDGALYRAGLKGVGGYARFTTSDEQLARGELEQAVRNLETINAYRREHPGCSFRQAAIATGNLERSSGKE